MSSVKTFRVDARLRNNLLIKAREALGYTSAAQAAKALDLNHGTLCEYEALSKSPWRNEGRDWNQSAVRIATAYKVIPELLWPDEIDAVRQTRVSMEIDTPAAFLEPPRSPEDRLLESGKGDTIQRALELLPERERQILNARFGFDGDEMTKSELADSLGVSPTRVWHLEVRALKKLRELIQPDGEPKVDLKKLAEKRAAAEAAKTQAEIDREAAEAAAHKARSDAKALQLQSWRLVMERNGYVAAEIAAIEKRNAELRNR